jgi:hypothetical protein
MYCCCLDSTVLAKSVAVFGSLCVSFFIQPCGVTTGLARTAILDTSNDGGKLGTILHYLHLSSLLTASFIV